MGLRYRKSINLGGGFRVNLSKSGISYSWGTKGYRVTKTVDGKTRQTLSIPGTGISYVTENSKSSASFSHDVDRRKSLYKGIDLSSGKEVLNYTNLDSGIYNDAIKSAIRGRRVAKALNIINFITFFIAISNPHLFVMFALLFVASVFIKRTLGTLKVEYVLDEAAQSKYNKLCNAWRKAFESDEISQISRTYITNNKKENCVAKTAIEPVKLLKPFLQKKPDLKTNINALQIPILEEKKGGRIGQVIFLPDRVLISRGTTLAAIEIHNIKTFVTIQPMAINPTKVPKDAFVSEYRYLHSNADGTPDKRYKDNPALPVVHYGRIDVEANGSTILSLLFSNSSIIEKLESDLPIENIKI